MSTFLNIDCGGEAVTLERTNNGDIIFHGWDEETELAAIELGFEPSACWIIWNAINEDALDRELFSQAYRGNALLVEALIFVGASSKAKNYGDWTPLHIAGQLGYTTVAKLLLEAGANVDAKDPDNWTPLHLAALSGRIDIVKLLLEAGASVYARTRDGQTPLGIASSREESNIVTIIHDWIEEHGE